MFCYQCEETLNGKGCTKKGICGKDEETANLIDLLIYLCKGISVRNVPAMENGAGNPDAGKFIMDSLFTTLTNVNFDKDRYYQLISEAIAIRDKIPKAAGSEHDACTWKPKDKSEVEEKAKLVGVLLTENEDVRSLRELLVYGLKGVSAYYHHAAILGFTDDEIPAFVQKGLASTLKDLSVDEMTGLVLECGGVGVKTLELLDRAHTTTFGKPEITTVKTTVRDRPGILITGHDLLDLKMLLEQTKGTGVDVYTHGEMLPAHGYPAFKGIENLVGNYGRSWWHQKEEFESFNGPVLITTNCIVPPKDSYKDRVYTTSVVGYPGLKHIKADEKGHKDFSALIEQAKKCSPPEAVGNESDLITGCAHDAVLALAGPVTDAIKNGAIRRFIVMAGCDGRHREREYYTEFAKALPADTVILTAGCAKYRYNSLGLGDIGGIPRVLDAGQCNDSYSLVVIAKALAEAFGVDINELPVSYNIAWYEQKAVLVLLALLNLGIKNITIGPVLPAFVSPAVLDVLVKNFGLGKNSTVEEDLKKMVPQ
ncbi:hydroxylamine reductase [Methanomicrobium antiquum]|uniref:Hydroxylamine reductase n=1 Tax=Methanomicrobium antiquum TaxID=487686 RepID=A0AAF0FMG9_9EURY|nr:hydroxylamine reductase [Methanomicrobium antiquum]WFN37188.1 hydroxylamine reductase [Methanomicrobium antiquum]